MAGPNGNFFTSTNLVSSVLEVSNPKIWLVASSFTLNDSVWRCSIVGGSHDVDVDTEVLRSSNNHEALIVGIDRRIIVHTLEVVELSQATVEENIEPDVEVFVLFET